MLYGKEWEHAEYENPTKELSFEDILEHLRILSNLQQDAENYARGLASHVSRSKESTTRACRAVIRQVMADTCLTRYRIKLAERAILED